MYVDLGVLKVFQNLAGITGKAFSVYLIIRTYKITK
jgi:hypothetical protein